MKRIHRQTQTENAQKYAHFPLPRRHSHDRFSLGHFEVFFKCRKNAREGKKNNLCPLRLTFKLHPTSPSRADVLKAGFSLVIGPDFGRSLSLDRPGPDVEQPECDYCGLQSVCPSGGEMLRTGPSLLIPATAAVHCIMQPVCVQHMNVSV